MSFALDLKSGLPERKKFIVYSNVTSYNTRPVPHECFQIDKQFNTIYFPFGSHRKYLDFFPNGDVEDYPKINENVKFVGELYSIENDPDKRNRDQIEVAQRALTLLEDIGCVFLSLFTGFGKTMLAIFLSIKIGLKIAVLCHSNEVKKQWIKSFGKFTNGTIKVQLLEGEELDPTADVYILGIIKASLMVRSDFENIGTVIVDEAHIVTNICFTKSMLNFGPRYCIGLSATPDRKDGLDKMLTFYFGERENFIVRKEKKPFTVYKYSTGIIPKTDDRIYRNGRSVPKWSSVVASVDDNPKTWEIVSEIALKHEKEIIIILCDRNALAIGVFELLKDKRKTAILVSKRKIWIDDYQILVTGFKKAGIGFDDPRLTMGIIASDTTDVRQYEGRIRTTDNIIYHLVHNHNTFNTHYKKCEEWYIEKGATIIKTGNLKKKGKKTASKNLKDEQYPYFL